MGTALLLAACACGGVPFGRSAQHQHGAAQTHEEGAPASAAHDHGQHATSATAEKSAGAAGAQAGVQPYTVTQADIGQTGTCVVTGEEYTVSAKTKAATYKGKTYFFCCPECDPDFAKDPEKYATK